MTTAPGSRSPLQIAMFVATLACAGVVIFPYYWMFVSSAETASRA